MGSGSVGWWGVVFLWKIREKGEGGGEGGGWGGDQRRNRQVNAQVLSKLPLANYPSVSPRTIRTKQYRTIKLFQESFKVMCHQLFVIHPYLSGSLMGSLAKGFFFRRKFCRNCVENLWKFAKMCFYCLRKECGTSQSEVRGHRFRNCRNFGQFFWQFPTISGSFQQFC